MEKNFTSLKVVLVEPNGPINVGSIARLCSNFEVDELRIVSPKCDVFSLESKKMALKGQIFIKKYNIFDKLEHAIDDCDLVIGTCGRPDPIKNQEFESPKDISRWISSYRRINNLAIVFGREDRGLTNRELLFAHKIFNIPTSKKFPSLNISHAVSIILYELNRFSTENTKKELKVYDLASSKQIKESFLEIEELLLMTGYLMKHTSFAKISKFKKYFIKAKTTSNEINILRGIIHQINWYLNNLKAN